MNQSLELQVCSQCRVEKELKAFHERRDRARGYNRICKECWSRWHRERTQELRRRVIEKLGGKCVRCGFSDSRALQIDHVNGGGTQENRREGNVRVMRMALADTEGKYQLLCANCNWIKRWENREFAFAARQGAKSFVRPDLDRVLVLRMFTGGESIQLIMNELNANRADVVGALKEAALSLKLDWPEVAWVRRAQLRRSKLQFGPQARCLNRIRRMESEIAGRVAAQETK